MIRNEQAQIVIIVAVLLMVTLIFLAVVIDGARLMIERQELKRAADAAGKAGLIVVGDRMVTQVVQAQTATTKATVTPTSEGSTPGPTLTPTDPGDEFFSWLDDDHKQTLVAPPMQTLVTTYAIAYAEENELGPSHPAVIVIGVDYPYHYHPDDHHLQIYVRIRRKVSVMFGFMLGIPEGELSGDAKQSIPHK
jgi:hypothetical protein